MSDCPTYDIALRVMDQFTNVNPSLRKIIAGAMAHEFREIIEFPLSEPGASLKYRLKWAKLVTEKADAS